MSSPAAHQPIVGETQLIVSLRTTDLATAKGMYPAALHRMTRLLAIAQVAMRRPEAATERSARKIIERRDRHAAVYHPAERDTASGVRRLI